MHLFQMRIRHVRVNLRRTEVFVPEHFLNRTEIRPVPEQIRREGMPECVR